MAQEIELKFIVNHDAVDALRNHLHTPAASIMRPASCLTHLLRNALITGHAVTIWAAYCRNGRYEMTMKIAGLVTGGLHQRPNTQCCAKRTRADSRNFRRSSA